MAADPKSVPAAKAVIDASLRLMRTYSDAANKLPSGDDYSYHSVFPGFAETMASHKARLERIVSIYTNIAVNPQRVARSSNKLYDAVDLMFENIDTLLDEANGLKMDAAAQETAFNGASVMDSDNASPEDTRHARSFTAFSGQGSAASTSAPDTVFARKAPATAIARPQLSFTRPTDNSVAPFRPLIFDLATHELTYGEAGKHPYQSAIEGFSYPAEQLRFREELLPAPLVQGNLHFVTSVEDLQSMIDTHLATSKEIAIDLEHHDIHSYQGITSLMQVSTRTEDFLVDVFPLRDHLHRLNQVFLDPKIVKVLHGCKEDIRWLQKDFGCYIVNAFDTGAALQTLHMPYSLAFAVDHYCQVKLNKQYQRADWRVRPLPADMVHYARQDTHYLLYIYDRLSNQLLQQEGGRAAVLGNLLVHVLNESRQLCLLQYEKPAFDENSSYRDGLGKALLGLLPSQCERARVLYNWREEVARKEDESPMAVMHSSSVVSVAVSQSYNKANLPTPTQLLRSIHPLSMAVRSHIKSLVEALVPTYENDTAPPRSTPKSGHTTEAGGVQQKSVRQLRHFPLSGTLPSIVLRNETPQGLMLEEDTASSPISSPAAVPKSFSTWMAAVEAQKQRVSAASIQYTSVHPPVAPTLITKAKVADQKEGQVDAYGAIRPTTKETLLMKAIREERATAVLGGASGEVLPDELEFERQDDDGDEVAAPAQPVGDKRPREEQTEAEVPKSLKEQYGLGRQQRKAHRKD
eukprot:GILI01012407.1.p1 GENE.GILI01012407.1~~GILI01012407.1.p1  ORF type:complete len:748 (+),score=191.69 GILI01012407.1:51-2294(+)